MGVISYYSRITFTYKLLLYFDYLGRSLGKNFIIILKKYI